MKHRWLALLLAVVVLLACTVVAFAAEGDEGWFSGVANFIKRLCVPDANYFHDELANLSEYANERLGGIAYLYEMLNTFFSEFKNATTASVRFSLPNGYFFDGYQGMSVDFLASARPYIQFLRTFLTAVVCVLTGIVCYHRIRTFFSPNG